MAITIATTIGLGVSLSILALIVLQSLASSLEILPSGLEGDVLPSEPGQLNDLERAVIATHSYRA